MQAIRPFIRPVVTATIGAMAGYGVTQKLVNKKDFFKPNAGQLGFVATGIIAPVYLGLSTVPALLTSFLISAAGTLLLSKDDVTEVKSPPPSPPPPLPEKIQEIVDAFSESFKSADKFGKQISDEFTKNFNALSSRNKKIICIQGIFTAFKKSSYKNVFNNSEIWKFLLKQLSEQTDIDDKEQITLDVAHGSDGKIGFNLKQLQGFLESLEYKNFPEISENILSDAWHQWRYHEIQNSGDIFSSITLNEVNTIFDCNPDTTDINNNILKKYNINTKEELQNIKNQYNREAFTTANPNAENFSNNQIITQAESEVVKFVSQLQPKKPFMKILNHNNAHYTGMVIEKNTDDTFSVSHINSSDGGTLQQVVFDNKQSLKNWIVPLINNGNSNHQTEDGDVITPENPEYTLYNTFFSDRDFKIDSGKITGLSDGKKNNFTPFGQDSCTCHQMSVMNLLKYYVEKCNKQVSFKKKSETGT